MTLGSKPLLKLSPSRRIHRICAAYCRGSNYRLKLGAEAPLRQRSCRDRFTRPLHMVLIFGLGSELTMNFDLSKKDPDPMDGLLIATTILRPEWLPSFNSRTGE